jgi:hypothetical protein
MGEEEDVRRTMTQFAAEGYELFVERGENGYFAPYMRMDSVGPGSAPYGWGRTALEAAEDAWSQFQKRQRMTHADAIRAINEGGSFFETGDEPADERRGAIAPNDVSRRDEPW